MQFLLTRVEMSSAVLMNWFIGKVDDLPERTLSLLKRIGENQTGLILMRLRSTLQKLDSTSSYFLEPLQRM